MKILMVAIPNHHFFQWVNQLKDSGHKVYWFDITDGGPNSSKINWVNQIKGWKLKWDFPLRSTIKKKLPKLYKVIEKYNENNTVQVFQKVVDDIRPDVIHCFEMQLGGLPILPVMKQNKIPFIYSSWGSDMFAFEGMGIGKNQVQQFLNRTNYLITDCKRDYAIAIENGFKAIFLGVFPGNGGLTIDERKIESTKNRNIILIKGYDDGVGQASVVLKALELVPKSLFLNKELVIYSADDSIKNKIESIPYFSDLKITIYSRDVFIENEKLLEFMGKSCIHIANSLSDGMPNALLESMGMGAFPIQSNPGNVTEEVIKDGYNGYLISKPLDEKNIAILIEKAIANHALREKAQDYNVDLIKMNYNREILQEKIIKLYKTIKPIQ